MGNRRAVFVGLSTLDIAYAVDRYPAEDSKTRASGMFLGAGGPAANAAITHAFLTGRAAPRERDTVLVTALGGHALSEPIRADLREQGVQVWDRAGDQAHRPPVSSIVVASETGSRTIVSTDGAERDPQPGAQASFLEDADVLLVDGHYPRLARRAAECAHGKVPVVLDGGRWREEIHRDLLPHIDIAICSETFAPPELAAGDTGALFDFLHDAGPRLVAITCGGRSIRYSGPQGRGEIAVDGTGVVDTLGAGDILHGAFCHFHTREADFPVALARAAEVATLSCRYSGTREWMRHFDIQSIR